ncbi:hypothetical protein GH865_07300 [Rhodocyclus tenuis]|nr:hypothetical protein [Rhodocyclus gracilis]
MLMAGELPVSRPRNLFGRTRHPYYILAPDFTPRSAGIRCLHLLCHALNELGEEAYLFHAKTTSPKLRTPLLDAETLRRHFTLGLYPVAVYPEVYAGNPLQLPAVARWLLNRPGHLGGDSVFPESDLLFAYDGWCIPPGMNLPYLSMPSTDTTVFNNDNNPADSQRRGACYYANKALAFGAKIRPEHRQLTSLCHDIPRSPAEIADILRRSEVLYCYEQSAIIHEARACGCPVLLVSSEYWDVDQEHGGRDVLFLAGEESLDDACGHALENHAVVLDPAISRRGLGSAAFDGRAHLFFYESTDFDLGVSDFTLEMWVRFQSLEAAVSQSLCAGCGSGAQANSWVLGTDAAAQGHVSLRLAVAGEAPVLIDDRPPQAGVWTHYALVRRHGQFTLFRDGTVAASAQFAGPMTTGISRLMIGAARGEGAEAPVRSPLRANLSELRLTKGEARYTAGFIPAPIPAPLSLAGSRLQLLCEPGIALASQADALAWATATVPYLALLRENWLRNAWENIRCFVELTQAQAARLAQHPLSLKDCTAYTPLENYWLIPAAERAQVVDNFVMALTHMPAFGAAPASAAGKAVSAEASVPAAASTVSTASVASVTSATGNAYADWMGRRQLQAIDGQYFQEHVATLWKRHPLVEFLVFVGEGQAPLLADTIDSLSAQFFEGWRLCVISQQPSPEPEFCGEHPTLRWRHVPDTALWSEAANAHLRSSAADWVGLFDAGTRFSPQLLLVLGDYLALHGDWRVVYTDEDALAADGERHSPLFKPDFSPDFLRSTDYIGNVFVKRQPLLALGGYPADPGAERVDIVLRFFDACGAAAIGHIPDVLYHVPENAFFRADHREVAAPMARHLARQEVSAEVEEGLVPPFTWRVRYCHATRPRVSVLLVAGTDVIALERCVERLLATTDYPDWEILIGETSATSPADASVAGDPASPATAGALGALSAALLGRAPERIRLLRLAATGTPALRNALAAQASGELVLFLDSVVEPIHADWLDVLVSHALRADVGAVGARLLSPHSLQVVDAGVVLGMQDGLGAVFANEVAHDQAGYLRRALTEQNYSALSGRCLLLRASTFHELGGFDAAEFAHDLYVADFCLKLRQRGKWLVWTPYATLLQHVSIEAAPTPQDTAQRLRETAILARRWPDSFADDPAWNRHLALCSRLPAVESELVASWNPDFRDRLRILGMPVGSQGQAEYRTFAPLRALHGAGLAQCAEACQPRQGVAPRAPTPFELARLAPDTLLIHVPVDNVRAMSLLHYETFNPQVLRIYQLDDLVTDIPPDNPSSKQLPPELVRERLRLGLAACDRLIVSTQPLADAYRELIDDIRVVPNMLEARVWSGLQSRRRGTKKPRVGWAGAQQHAGDLRLIAEVVKATADEVDWVFFGMMPAGVSRYVAEFHDVVVRFEEYPAKLATLDLDLAVAPLVLHPFNEAKSNLRLLEYGAMAWPVVCSDAYPYRTNDAPVTRLANDPEQWIACLREKVRDRDALAAEGDALKAWVYEHYILEEHLERWLSALRR